jgi:hypothetical protein
MCPEGKCPVSTIHIGDSHSSVRSIRFNPKPHLAVKPHIRQYWCVRGIWKVCDPGAILPDRDIELLATRFYIVTLLARERPAGHVPGDYSSQRTV